jgi:hypothetical protein
MALREGIGNMKKIYQGIAFAVIFVIIGSTLMAQDEVKSGELDLKERVFDFGLVPRDAKVVHNFVLKNVGNDTLRILNIKPGCSCTTAPIDKRNIAVNDSTVMPVTFSTGKRSGNTSKGVNVTTDMEPRGLFPISIEAYVESPTMNTPELTAEPRSIEYTPPDANTREGAETELINNSDSDILVKIVDYSSELGIPKLTKDRIKPGKKTQLVFDFDPQLNYKALYGSVTLEVSGDGLTISRYTVPIIRNRPVDYKSK